MPGQVDVLATYLYQMVATGFAPAYGKAAALGMSILSASIALIVLSRALTAESCKYVTISGRGYRLSSSEEHTSEIQSLMRISYAILWFENQSDQRTTSESAL